MLTTLLEGMMSVNQRPTKADDNAAHQRASVKKWIGFDVSQLRVEGNLDL